MFHADIHAGKQPSIKSERFVSGAVQSNYDRVGLTLTLFYSQFYRRSVSTFPELGCKMTKKMHTGYLQINYKYFENLLNVLVFQFGNQDKDVIFSKKHNIVYDSTMKTQLPMKMRNKNLFDLSLFAKCRLLQSAADI